MLEDERELGRIVSELHSLAGQDCFESSIQNRLREVADELWEIRKETKKARHV